MTPSDLPPFLRAHARPLALAACLLLVWYISDLRAETTTPPARTEAAPAAATKPTRAPVTKIIGADAARSDQPLTDPFSSVHETRTDLNAPPPAKASSSGTATPPASRDAQVRAVGEATPAPAPAPALTLKGITQGPGTAAATIDDGTQTHLVFVGDTVGNATVTTIDDHTVTLTNAHGTRALSLPGY